MRPDAEPSELGWIIVREHNPLQYPKLYELYLENWPRGEIFALGRNIRPNIGRDPDEIIFVAENNTDLIGSVFYRRKEDQACILNLVVRKDARRQGIARELVKRAEEQATCDGLSKVTITAKTDELVKYYHGLGFILSDPHERSMEKFLHLS